MATRWAAALFDFKLKQVKNLVLNIRQRKSDLLPGWTWLFLVAVAAYTCSRSVQFAGKYPLEESVLAILFGMALRNAGLIKEPHLKGIKTAEKFLVLGIVLLGAALDFNRVVAQGLTILAIISFTMILGYIGTYLIARGFGLSFEFASLMAIGTTICGTSAIAIAAPLVAAKDEETSYAVATISLWGLLAIVVYPYLAKLVGASELGFGVFAGTAIHSTPQVVGAAYLFSDGAGQTATAVKLVRNCFMAPLALAIGVVAARKRVSVSRVRIGQAFPWFLFGYFVMAFLSSHGVFASALIEKITEVGKFLILVGMAGIGLNTSLSTFSKVGTRPLVVGFVGALLVAVCSMLLIRLLL